MLLLYVPIAAVSPSGILKTLGFVLFGLMVYGGYLNKLYAATVTLFVTVFAVLISLSFFEPLALALTGVAGWTGRIAHGVVMMLLFLVTYVCCYALATAKLPTGLNFHKYVDNLGGAVMGCLTGMVFAGFMLLALYLFPLAGYEGHKRTFLDCDRTVTRLAAVIHSRIPWRTFDPAHFLSWSKTVNAPRKRRRPPEPERARYSRPTR